MYSLPQSYNQTSKCKRCISSNAYCYFATLLKTQAYPIHRGNGQKYIHWSEFWNAQGTGYMQTLMPVWNEIYDLFARHQAEWEQKGLDVETINRLYQEAEEKIKPAYYRLMRVD